MAISNSLGWNTIKTKLMGDIKALPYNRDLYTMLNSIDGMVSMLSRLEVEARRTKKTSLCAKQLDEINTAIEKLEQWIVLAALLG